MKIGNNADLNAYSKVGGTTTGTPEAGAAKAGTAASGEGSKVELSSAASSLIAGAPDDGSFDAEKVARIASAIEKGEFKINADAIADKLIANAAEMLGRTQPSH